MVAVEILEGPLRPFSPLLFFFWNILSGKYSWRKCASVCVLLFRLKRNSGGKKKNKKDCKCWIILELGTSSAFGILLLKGNGGAGCTAAAASAGVKLFFYWRHGGREVGGAGKEKSLGYIQPELQRLEPVLLQPLSSTHAPRIFAHTEKILKLTTRLLFLQLQKYTQIFWVLKGVLQEKNRKTVCFLWEFFLLVRHLTKTSCLQSCGTFLETLSTFPFYSTALHGFSRCKLGS